MKERIKQGVVVRDISIIRLELRSSSELTTPGCQRDRDRDSEGKHQRRGEMKESGRGMKLTPPAREAPYMPSRFSEWLKGTSGNEAHQLWYPYSALVIRRNDKPLGLLSSKKSLTHRQSNHHHDPTRNR